MEDPVSVSLGVLRSLPAKLERLLSPEANHGLHKGDQNKIHLLKCHLQELIDKYLMEPSEVEDRSSTARCWVKEVRELSYDMDDFVDELVHGFHATTASQKNLRCRIAKAREGMSRSCWVAYKTARFRSRLEDAIQRHVRYNLDKRQGGPIRLDSDEPPISPLYGPKGPRLVGIDSSIEKLCEWLTGDGEPQLRVVSVVGFGGIGKTTLANELYAKLRRQFECRAFGRSSQKPDIRRLLTSILLQIRRHRPPDDSELHNHTLIETIRAHLQHKKYFIIIDELWASSTWDIIHQAFPDDKCCSRILITTENGVVAQRCCGHNSEHIFKMGPLRDNESRKLFSSIVLSNQSKDHEQFNTGSYEIVRKCGGFPLATVTTAALLATQQNGIEQCDYIRRSLQTNPTSEGMKEVLFFCYNNLPERLKACMLYLSVYNEDHIIWKDDLIKQWITEGFICAKEGKDMEEIASIYFDELINAGMIQPVEIKYNGEVLSCNVHYMILHMIRYKSIEENFVTAIDHTRTNIRLADKVRRLSLHFGDAEDAAQPEKLRLLQVRSLFFFGLLKSLPSVEEFRLLQVLVLHLWGDQDDKSFNLTTVKLFRLRYLQIVCNVTLNLENQMQGLQYLETLKIDSRVNEVPPDIVHLPGLLHLSLPSDTILPSGIGCMVSLHTLGCFDLSRNSEDNVVSLGKLTNLRDLHLACSTTSDNLLKKLQCLGSVISKLCNLKSLTLLPAGFSNANTLETCTSSKDISCDFGSVSSPPALLQKLELLPRVCIFSILPKWIGKLHLLRILKIEIVALFSEDVDILKGLPALTDLSLYVHTAPAQRIVFGKEGFSVLKNLKFICVAPFITFMEGAMPNVRRLKLGFRANTIKQFSPIDVGFKHLIGLEVFFAKIGGAVPGETGREAAKFWLDEAFVHHQSPPVIDIQLVDFIFDRDIEKQSDSRIILPSGPASHMKDQESSSLLQEPVEEDKKTRTREENCHIMEQHDEIVEQDTEETHRIQVNESGEVTRKQAVTGTSMASSSHIQKPARTAWHSLIYKYRSITGTGSKNSSKNATDTNTNTFGTKRWLNVRRFTLSELKASTMGFRSEVLLGEGRYGRVYKGWLDECTLAPTTPDIGMLVAVEWLSQDVFVNISWLSADGSYLGQLSHPNLVKLIGYCLEGEQLLLVYEFMARGSLKNYLIRRGPHSSLSWEIRMKVALGAARGLAFLHNDQAVIYRDLRTSSILLDSEYNAKLADFGLLVHGPSGTTHVSTRLMESSGYAAPEYVTQGQLTAKNNVYSYGVLLLELLSGLPLGDTNLRVDLHMLVQSDKRRVSSWLDSRLGSAYSLRAARKTAALALRCLSTEPRRRPKMEKVVTLLEGLQ